MLKVGITGNIGSGKTTVSKIFGLLGVPIFYADEAARQVMVTDAELTSGVKQNFGAESYFNDGSLNRKHLAGRVFNDATQLAILNKLVHPAVFRAFDEWTKQQKTPYVIKEAAILFESGSYKLCDKSIIVTAPLAMRMQRIISRDGISNEEAMSRESRQMPQDEKMKLADYSIINDGTELVIPQVTTLHHKLLALASC